MFCSMEQILLAVALCMVLLVPVTQAVTANDTGAGTVYKLKVLQDVTLESQVRNFNYLEYLIVAKHPGFPNRRSLLQFENLPATCPLYSIKWAKMYLYFDHAHKKRYQSPEYKNVPEITRNLDVHLVKSSWDESQATSLYRFRGAPWCSQLLLGLHGCDAEPCAQGDEVSIFPLRPAGFVEFDITPAVKSWSQGTPNYGVVVRATNELDEGREVRFFSKSYSDETKHAFVNVLCA